MTSEPRITDRAITEMLLDRVAAPMPADLTQTVLSSMRFARIEGRATRGGASLKPLLLVAAALAVAGGAAIVAITGSRPNDPDRASQPPAVAASASLNPNRWVIPTYSPPPLCPWLDEAAQRGGVDTGPQPVAGVRPAVVSNGQVLLLAGLGADPSVFDPFAPTPSPRRISTWDMRSLNVNAWAATGDGTVVAAEIGEGDCASEIWVMRTDGTSLRRPFRSAGRHAFGASWSPDDSRLAFATGPGVKAPRNVQASESTLLVWDSATGSSLDLGRPCDKCVTVAQEYRHPTPVWSPDGARLATEFTNLGCRDESEIPCQGIAIASLDGSWSIVPVPDPGQDATYQVLRWVDPDTLLVKQLFAGVFHVDVSTGVMARSGTLPMGSGIVPLDRALSPDGAMSLRTSDGPGIDVVHIALSTTTHLEPFPIGQLDATWSPDSRYVLVQAVKDESTPGDRGIYLAPVDGSEAPRRVLEGSFGLMVWLEGGAP